MDVLKLVQHIEKVVMAIKDIDAVFILVVCLQMLPFCNTVMVVSENMQAWPCFVAR